MTDSPMTIAEVMAELRTSRSQVDRYMRRKDDPLLFYKVGKRWLVRRKDFDKWVRRNATLSAAR